jgi:hypothetical protein
LIPQVLKPSLPPYISENVITLTEYLLLLEEQEEEAINLLSDEFQDMGDIAT